jgi:hypothetical protein
MELASPHVGRQGNWPVRRSASAMAIAAAAAMFNDRLPGRSGIRSTAETSDSTASGQAGRFAAEQENVVGLERKGVEALGAAGRERQEAPS